MNMVAKLTTGLAIGLCLALAACNTVRGAAADINSAANCTENTIKSGYCK
jgi:predicted small secreted protein